MTKKYDEVLQIPITGDQMKIIDAAFKFFLNNNEKVITKPEFVRQQLILKCLLVLKMMEVPDDNEIGYTVENSKSCGWLCNNIKMNWLTTKQTEFAVAAILMMNEINEWSGE